MEKAAEEYPGISLYFKSVYKRMKCFGATGNNSEIIESSTKYKWKWPFIDLQYMVIDENNKFSKEFNNNLTIKELGGADPKKRTVCLFLIFFY